MKALYRKYRPQALSEVVGQTAITDSLAATLAKKQPLHAYLFVGPRGTGKTSVARIFAHAVNDFKYQIEDSYLDIIEIDGASNRGIDSIRELREKATIAPTQGRYKVYIVDEVHMLTKEAFNALLKILEEPPAHIIFILATTDVHKVPITITSRAQVYTFKLADEATMLNFLQTVAKAEKIKITKEALKIITRRSGGSFRDALSLLDQISTLTTAKIDEAAIIQALGLPTNQTIDILIQAHQANDLDLVTNTLKDALSSGTKAETIATELINHILKNPQKNLLPLLQKLIDVRGTFAKAKLLLALLPPPTTQALTTQTTSPTKVNQPLAVTPTKHSSPPPASPTPKSTKATFTWETFLSTVRQIDDLIYTQIINLSHDFQDGTLHLYANKVSKKILLREKSQNILRRALGDYQLAIEDASDLQPKSSAFPHISDIMGDIQEVIDDGGEIPF